VIWMVSSIATGELIFTPRVASLYGYTVIWMVAAAIFLKALIAHEIGRYAVATGTSFLRGATRLPGPKNWGVLLIILPQFLVMVSTVAGLAGAAGSAAILLLPGDFKLWSVLFIWAAAALVLLGKYRGVELISMALSAVVIVALVFTASLVFPGFAEVAAGLVPGLPPGADLSELLPWLGFVMSGAAGLVWYSYWLNERGYGTAAVGEASLKLIGEGDKERLRRWIKVMAASTAIASTLVLILLIALMVLGAELLRPEGLLPEGPRVTAVLSRLLGAVWGPAGTWLMVLGSLFAFSSSLVGNVDGWSRMQGEGSVMVARQLNAGGKLASTGFYRYLYVIGLMGLVPTFFVLVKPEPLIFLVLSGTIEAIHIPFVTMAILYVNVKTLPDGLKPSPLMIILTLLAALFYIFFAFYYIHTIVS